MKGKFKITFLFKYVSIAIVAIAVVITAYAFNFYSYKQQLLKVRAQKDAYFKTSASSPIKNTHEFEQLVYFPPNNDYVVHSQLSIFKQKEFEFVWASDGKKLRFQKYGILTFMIEGKKCQLTLYKHLDTLAQHYFLPFRDSTNGKETHPSGRFLGVEVKDTADVILDFNRSYNPYCAYSYSYRCPLPPYNNYLKAYIKAGEKK